MTKYFAILITLLLPACASMTPSQQAQTSQIAADAGLLVSTALQLYSAAGKSKLTPQQTAALQAIITKIATTSPQAAQIAQDALYGAAAMGQAGVPVSQGTTYKLVGQSIQSNTPALSPNATAALLQTVAASIPAK